MFSHKNRQYSSVKTKISKPLNEIKILIVGDGNTRYKIKKSVFKKSKITFLTNYLSATYSVEDSLKKNNPFDFILISNDLQRQKNPIAGLKFAETVVNFFRIYKVNRIPVMALLTGPKSFSNITQKHSDKLKQHKIKKMFERNKSEGLFKFMLQFVDIKIFKKKENVKILLVDDSEDYRELIPEKLLGNGDFDEKNIRAVSSFERAVEIFWKESFDIILLDYKLSSKKMKNGVSLARNIHNKLQEKHILFPLIILCTSSDQSDFKQQDLEDAGIIKVCGKSGQQLDELKKFIFSLIEEPQT